MAKAKKCNICGQYYDDNKKYRKRNIERIRFTNGKFIRSDEIDLCDDCIDELIKFLNTEEGKMPWC